MNKIAVFFRKYGHKMLTFLLDWHFLLFVFFCWFWAAIRFTTCLNRRTFTKKGLIRI